MKVYFTTSYSGALEYNKQIKFIIKQLEELGHKVSKRSLKIYVKVDEENSEIFDYMNMSVDEAYKLNMRRIREADVVVADLTVPSSGGGYEIAIAENERKPILGLVNSKSSRILSESLLGNKSKNLQIRNYDSEDTIKKVLVEFFNTAKDSIDTKFILIISPEIDRYLEWASEERRQHKAQIVRNSIEEAMSKDKDYKDFLKTMAN